MMLEEQKIDRMMHRQPQETTKATPFEPGDKVKVVLPLAALEKTLLGRVFEFKGFTTPHGYARCVDDRGEVMLHPEALELVEQGKRTFLQQDALYLLKGGRICRYVEGNKFRLLGDRKVEYHASLGEVLKRLDGSDAPWLQKMVQQLTVRNLLADAELTRQVIEELGAHDGDR